MKTAHFIDQTSRQESFDSGWNYLGSAGIAALADVGRDDVVACIDLQKLEDRPQQVAGIPLEIVEESHEHLAIGVILLPAVDVRRVGAVSQRPRGVEAGGDLLFGELRDLAKAGLSEMHRESRPGSLDRVPDQVDDLRIRHQPVDVFDVDQADARVPRAHLAGDLALDLRKQSAVPFVGPSPQAIAHRPIEIGIRFALQGRDQILAQVDLRLAQEILSAHEPDGKRLRLVVEVMKLLDRRHPDLRMGRQVLVEPGRSGFLSTDAEEIREHSKVL